MDESPIVVAVSGRPIDAPVGDGTMGVVVLVPAFNEKRFIASVVFPARPFAQHVVVIAGSTDRTAELAEAAGAIVACMVANGGTAAALQLRHPPADGRDS